MTTSASSSTPLAVSGDNPCWGSPSQCSLEDLLERIDGDDQKRSILYDSDQYLVLNKPPDLRMDGPYAATVHKLLTFWYPTPSLIETVWRQLEEDESTTEVANKKRRQLLLDAISNLHQHNHLRDNFLRPCHQLDYATSGILLVAKTREASAHVQRQLEDRQVQKTYLAIVTGHVLGNVDGDSTTTTLPSRFPVWNTTKLQQDGENTEPKDDSEAALREYLQRLEKQYRKSRDKQGKQNRRIQQLQRKGNKKGKSKETFDGYQPVHSIFQKWKARMASAAKAKQNASNGVLDPSASNTQTPTQKKRKRQKQSLLTESDWKRIWEPVDAVVSQQSTYSNEDENWFRSLEWKKLGGQHAALKEAMVEATDLHNDTLRDAARVRKEESEEAEKGHLATSDLPTIFRLAEGDSTDTTTEDSFYTFCPLADDAEKFSMVVPTKITTEYPHMPAITQPAPNKDDSDYDFKPSLTKCTVVQQGIWKLPNGNLLPVTKVKLSLLTGRRHQLRVHMALAGHPILGDATYSEVNTQADTEATTGDAAMTINQRQNGDISCSRMCLHAFSLSLPSLLGEKEPNWSVVAPDPFRMNEDEKLDLSLSF